MKTTWRGPYRGGEIVFESDSREAIDEQLDQMKQAPPADAPIEAASVQLDYPKLSGNIGCSEAIRQSLGNVWGKKEPRTMTELQQAFEANAIFYGSGTLSGLLTHMTKTGELRRLDKAGKWGYVLAKQSGGNAG